MLMLSSIECLGPAIALLLSPPDKVQRSDGTKVVLQKKLGNKEEFVALLKLSITRRVSSSLRRAALANSTIVVGPPCVS